MNTTASAATKTDLHACACSGFAAVDVVGRETRTGCAATTRRTFAPGHDARLKGFLIRAGREGLLIRTPEGGADQVPVRVAERFGFGHMVREGITRPARTRKPRAAKTAAPAPRTVIAKVGRWMYEGTVTANGEVFSYTDRRGSHLTAEKFTIVASA